MLHVYFIINKFIIIISAMIKIVLLLLTNFYLTLSSVEIIPIDPPTYRDPYTG